MMSGANSENPLLEQRAPSVATPAARRAVAALSGRVLGAPVGFVRVGEVVDFRGAPVSRWQPGDPDQVAWTVSRLLRKTSTATHFDDLSSVVDPGELTFVRALAAAPVRAPSGNVVGHVGALDLEERAWTRGDMDAIEDFAAMVGATPDLQASVDTADVHQHVRSLVQEVRALDDSLTPLVQYSEEKGDAVLSGHIATVRGRVGAVLGKQDRLRARAGIVGPVAGSVDLARLVVDVVASVDQRSSLGPLRLDIEPGEFPVMTGAVATKGVIEQFVEHSARQFGSDAVAISLRRVGSAESLHGRDQAQLDIVVDGFVRAGDLARAGAGFARAKGLPVAGSHIQLQGDRIRLVGDDVSAESSAHQTRIRASWSLETD